MGGGIYFVLGVTQLKPFSEGAPSQKEAGNEVNRVTSIVLTSGSGTRSAIGMLEQVRREPAVG